MQIHKSPNETQEEFLARAFRWNRLVGDAFARRQARYATREELRAPGMLPTAPAPLRGVSRVRAIWYGAGLVFGAVCIAMAVFGMGQ